MKMYKILIVEDEGIVAIDLKNRLTRMGYLVVGIANKGDQAISIAQEMLPDLVLMDIRLQGELDGIETAAQISSRFGILVVYLSAMIDPDTRQRADMTQPSGYLSKPFDDHSLKTAVENALKGINC